MSISVSVDTSKLNELLAKIPGNKESILKSTAFYTLYEARKLAPYRTGHLKNNSRVETKYDGWAVVEFNAEYAAYVELGTYKMAAQPFLTPAVLMSEKRLTYLLKSELIK